MRGVGAGQNRKRRKPWRFNAHWIRKEECERVVREGWDSASDPDCFGRLFESIKACQLGLRCWAGAEHNNPRKRIERLIEKIHTLSIGAQTEAIRLECAEARAELEKLYMDEAIFWRQRSKTRWAREGDRNTAYFHAAASKRNENNAIHGLLDSNGVWQVDDREIENIITGYFGELFQSSQPSVETIDEVIEHVGARVNSEMNQHLLLPFSADEANVDDAEVIKDILARYAAASGQIINLEKSTLVFSPNTSTEVIEAIRDIIPFQVVAKFDKYLGLPARIGKSKTEVFAYLKERMWSRVQGWSEKHLSMAGREVLIKAVLQSIPTYVMSCFKLPDTILDEMEKL